MHNEKSLEEQLYVIGLFSLAIGFVLLFIYLYFIAPRFSYPCMLWYLFGIYCPGCGGTRALQALLQGRVLLSLWYHPFVLYAAILGVGFMGTHTLEKLKIGRVKGWKFHSWYLYGGLVVIFGNWILKNILLQCFHIVL